jgi:hypothetical protein
MRNLKTLCISLIFLRGGPIRLNTNRATISGAVPG